MPTPPPRPKNAAPALTPKQITAVKAVGDQNGHIYGAAVQFKMKGPLAKAELQKCLKTAPQDQKLAIMVKLTDGQISNAPKLQSACLNFGSKCVKNVAAGKLTYVAFKAEANKIERLCIGLLAYADKYHENHSSRDFPYRGQMMKLVDGFCDTFGKQVDDLLKAIDKL